MAESRNERRRRERDMHKGDDGERKRVRDRLLVNRWKNHYIPAARKEKKRFQQDADKVDKYFSSDHSHLYKSLGHVIDTQNLICMTVNLSAQVRAYMGPHLYSKNPTRTVQVKGSDTVLSYYAKVCDVYLNATPVETNLKEDMRASIDDALVPGRGAALTTFDRRSKRLVHTKQVPIDDVLIDPDARCVDEALWIAVRCTEPLFELKERYPKTTKTLKENLTAYSENEGRRSPDAETERDEGITGHSTHLVRYYKIWTKFGSGLVRGRAPKGDDPEEHGVDLGGTEDGSRFRYMVLALGHDRPLYEGDWPVPLHIDDEWPIGFLDFTPTRKGARSDTLWPVSLMKLGLSHQEAIDLLSTLLINACRYSVRKIAGVLANASDEVKSALTSNKLHVAVPLKADQGVTDIRQVLQLLDMGNVDRVLLELLEWNERKFGEVTGLSPILKGGLPGDEAQLRSATEAAMRDRNSRSRLEDMAERVESFASRCARREMIAIRLCCKPRDVERVVYDKVEKAYKVKVSIGPRPLSTKELRDGFWPKAGQYFKSMQEAEQVAQELLQAMGPSQDGIPSPIQMGWVAKYPDVPFVPSVEATEVSIEELWFDTAGMEPKEIAREFSTTVEAGSARRRDYTLEVEQNQFVMSEVGNMAKQLQLWDVLNRAYDKVYNNLQTPKEERVFLPAQQLMQQQQQAQQAAQQAQAQQAQQEFSQKLTLEQVKQQAAAQRQAMQAAANVEAQVTGAAAKMLFDPPGAGGVQ